MVPKAWADLALDAAGSSSGAGLDGSAEGDFSLVSTADEGVESPEADAGRFKAEGAAASFANGLAVASLLAPALASGVPAAVEEEEDAEAALPKGLEAEEKEPKAEGALPKADGDLEPAGSEEDEKALPDGAVRAKGEAEEEMAAKGDGLGVGLGSAGLSEAGSLVFTSLSEASGTRSEGFSELDLGCDASWATGASSGSGEVRECSRLQKIFCISHHGRVQVHRSH